MAEMTAAELDSLASTARKLARERKKTEKQRARVLPALKAAKELAESRVEALEVAIEEAEAGKAVDLKALRVKISRRVSPTPTTREAIKRTWTPERRAAQQAGALETNAKRRKAKLAK
jgi:phenylalanyl-tRNA synthetase alpha subunit